MLLIAEVDHGNQKWYYINSSIHEDTINLFSSHFFRRYAEREDIPFAMPKIITNFFMVNRNQIKIYESEDLEQTAYAFRNGISLSKSNPSLGHTLHFTYVSRDMLGETQEDALCAVLDEIDRAESFQRDFKPIYKATDDDFDSLIESNRKWEGSGTEASRQACEIYSKYFEEGME